MSADDRIRVAGTGDQTDVTALLIAFRDYYGEDEPADATVETTVEKLLADESTEFLLAGEPAAGLAQIRYRLSAWTGAPDAWLEDLFVVEGARSAGLGRALAEACVERARARGARRIQLDANERNEPALALYESLGFDPATPGRWDGGRNLYLTKWL